MHIAIEDQGDAFAVYVTDDGDVEGNHDRMFSYDRADAKLNAHQDAVEYAAKLGKKLGMKVVELI